jgi:hypothetical protein
VPASDSKAFRTEAVAARAFAVVAGVAFAAFVIGKGIPTLRHDWNWPVDRLAIPSFLSESANGWLSVGFGVASPHPTTYLIAVPLAIAMWIFGPLAALGSFAFAIGYCCVRGASGIAARWANPWPARVGIALFALFNPWVYNEVVAGHLVMILAYGGVLGLLGEMTRGQRASPVRLALWLILIEAQLQFFIVAAVASILFAFATKKWLPIFAGAVAVLPSAIGVIAERSALLHIPYGLEWQANQSVAPLALLSLGGYFAGYADRLGLASQLAVWAIVALAIVGTLAARRRRAAICSAAAAVFIYLVVAGVRGPLAVPYEWIVRQIPESGVFRELYDLAGIFAALLVLLACAATTRARFLAYCAMGAGVALCVTWILRAPGDLWVSSSAYPRASVSAPALSRVAFLPAFQPLQLRAGGGDGADPDIFVYPGAVAPINEYYPTYPVDMALGEFEQNGNEAPLRALGVSEIVDRPWFVSRSKGTIGLAAASLNAQSREAARPSHYVAGATPLVSRCDEVRMVAFDDRIADCDVFFGDAPGYGIVDPFDAQSNSIDPRTAWIDARLAFARLPSLAQGLGGTLTQSTLPHSVRAGSWLLAYVDGRLAGNGGRNLASGTGRYSWIFVPTGVDEVVCYGLCELAAQSPTLPAIPRRAPARAHAAAFDRFAPWLYAVRGADDGARLLRLNERYDAGWVALSGWRLLPHVRLDRCINGWFLTGGSASSVILVQVTALLQLIAEILGASCLVLLLKALAREPTKRV